MDTTGMNTTGTASPNQRGTGEARGFARPHLGTLRRADGGVRGRPGTEHRGGLCGFRHWRDALDVVDRCLGVLGAPDSLIRLLTRLCSHVPTEAWEADTALIVWPSNALLAVELAMEVRSVQRLMATAEAHGLLVRRLGNGHRRTNRRLGDGSLATDAGIDLAPLLERARVLEDTLDMPRRLALARVLAAAGDVQAIATLVIEGYEAIEQAIVDGTAGTHEIIRSDGAAGGVDLSPTERVSIDAGIEHADSCRKLVQGLRRRLGTLDLARLNAALDDVERMRGVLRTRQSAIDEILRRIFEEPAQEQVPVHRGSESSEGDSGVVQNNDSSTSSCLGSAADGPVLARPAAATPPIPGLADTPPALRLAWRRDIAAVAPSYAARFRVSHLLQACPALSAAADLWGVAPEHWDDLAEDPLTLEMLCRHAATVAGFRGDRWSAEARRWGLARAVLATAAALGKPPHRLRQSSAALLSWYFTDGLARPGLDLLASINSNRRHWKKSGEPDADERDR